MSPKTTSFISYLTLAISIVVLVVVFQTQGQLSRYGADAAPGGSDRFQELCVGMGGKYSTGTASNGSVENKCTYTDGTFVTADTRGTITGSGCTGSGVGCPGF